ncbi:MAG: serine/threonine protein kinase [Deltaproteobacteria bacterium]|nr:serine/threonine protein kinase [Deltaproteobacteria bacterium]
MSQTVDKTGRYIIVNEIARGGMATVFRGKLVGVEGFEKVVAIKQILPHWTDQQEFVNMLIDEAKILVHLHHNNIVQVIDLAKENNHYFIVMEYVDGLDLRKMIVTLNRQRKVVPVDIACHIIKKVCLGLDFAHSRNNAKGEPLHIVHRDISPQNVLVSFEGDVKITDFGIARIRGRSQETQDGVLKGKFSYMSPEQALGQKTDSRSDIFSLGALFYELLTGSKCFDGDNDLDTIEKVKIASVYFPCNMDERLRAIIARALSKNREDRYQSVRDFFNELRFFEEVQGIKTVASDLKDFVSQYFAPEETDLAVKSDSEQATRVDKGEAEVLTRVMTAVTCCERPLSDESRKTAVFSYNPHKAENTTRADTMQKLMPKRVEKTFQGSSGIDQRQPCCDAGLEATVLDGMTVLEKQRPCPPVYVKPECHIEQPVRAKKPRLSRKAVALAGMITGVVLIGCLILWKLDRVFLHGSVRQIVQKSPTAWQNSRDNKGAVAAAADGHPATEDPRLRRQSSRQMYSSMRLTAFPADTKIEAVMNGHRQTATGRLAYQTAGEDLSYAVSVVLTREGYFPKSMEWQINRDHLIVNKNIRLEKISYGSVVVSTRPWGVASVTGGSKQKGAGKFRVPAGRRLVSVYNPSSKKRLSRYVNVAENTTVNCRASFGAEKNYMVCR